MRIGLLQHMHMHAYTGIHKLYIGPSPDRLLSALLSSLPVASRLPAPLALSNSTLASEGHPA